MTRKPKRTRRAPRRPPQQHAQLIVRERDGREWLLGNVQYLNVRALSGSGMLDIGPRFMQPTLRGPLSIDGVVDAPDGMRVTFTESADGKLVVK